MPIVNCRGSDGSGKWLVFTCVCSAAAVSLILWRMFANLKIRLSQQVDHMMAAKMTSIKKVLAEGCQQANLQQLVPDNWSQLRDPIHPLMGISL